MANAKIIAQKEEEVKKLAEKIKSAKVVVMTDYRGITVEDVTKLRADLRAVNAEYVVIKNNITRRALKEAGIEGVEDSVKLLGGLPSEKVRQLMEKATALIMASRAEAFGRVTAEAMFAGCLVIGRDTAGTKEQLDNGLTQIGREIGLRFSNVHELSQHMFDITYKGIETYFPMIKDSQNVVRHLYTTESYAEGVKNFYKQIINNKGTK